VLTIDEIRQRHHAQWVWVLIEDPQTDEGQAVKGGVVAWHSANRDEVYRKAVEQRRSGPRRFAVIYTGEIPAPGTAMAPVAS
jgi:hypothetical protein